MLAVTSSEPTTLIRLDLYREHALPCREMKRGESDERPFQRDQSQRAHTHRLSVRLPVQPYSHTYCHRAQEPEGNVQKARGGERGLDGHEAGNPRRTFRLTEQNRSVI